MHMLAPVGYPPPPSTVELCQWSFWEVEDDHGSPVILLSGLRAGSQTRLRLTSQIVKVEASRVITRTGSSYELVGPPATEQDVKAQASRRRALLAGREARDVTHEYGEAW